LATRRTSRSLTTAKWVLVGAGLLFVSLLLIGVLFREKRDGTFGRLILAALGVVILTVPVALLIDGTLQQAHEYLLLHTMEAETDPSRPWWERLGDILAASSADVMDPFEKLQVGVLWIIVAATKLCVSVKTRCFGIRRPDDEGGITLT
jgi:hypothetical protein